MFIDFKAIQTLGANQLEAATAATTATAKGLQAISTETAEFSKKRVDKGIAFGEKLMQARKLDEIILLQTDFAKTTYDDFISQTTKIGTIFSDLAKEAFATGKAATDRASVVASAVTAPIAAKQASLQK